MSSNIGGTSDEDLIRFEIRDGVRRIKCSVSNEALEAASGLADQSAPGLRRRSFDRFRTLIHAAAALRLNVLPPGFTGPIVLTTRDLRCVPPERGTPLFGVAARPSTPRATTPQAIESTLVRISDEVMEESIARRARAAASAALAGRTPN